MTTPDLSKMTKDELLKLAAKNKVSVKKTQLKKEILTTLKKELKKTEPSPKATARTKAKRVVKKAVTKAKTATTRKKKTPATQKKSALSSSPSGRQAMPGSGTKSLHPKFELEDSAQEAKFILGKPDMHDESHQEVLQELPDGYGDNKLVLLVRDPHWCFLYWELQSENIQSGLGRLNRSENEVRHVLRIHSLSTGGTYFDADIDFRARSHYIQLSPSGASFFAEIGFLDQEGHFAALAVSNTVTLPLDRPSEIIDEQWMTTNENFEEIYVLSGGHIAGDTAGRGLNRLGASEKLSEQSKMDFSSTAVSSFSSGAIHNPPEKSFNYWLNAELVLFGGADLGATIKLSGENLELRPDGTFSARFALPDGTLNLPVTFESQDLSEVHTVTPKIDRKTVANPKEVEQ